MGVYFASALEDRYPHIFTLISGMLDEKGIGWVQIKGASNIWCRDWMPIRTGNGYTKFNYRWEEVGPWPQLHVSPEQWTHFLPKKSPIVLDGGNVEQSNNMVLMSEIVLQHNAGMIPNKSAKIVFVKTLEDIFGKKIIFLPVELGDSLGHVDGIARFIDDGRVIVNNFFSVKDREYLEYQKTVERILMDNGLEIKTLPNIYHKTPKMSLLQFHKRYPLADDFNPGFGYYINFYKIGNLFFMPVFNMEEDNDCYNAVREYFPEYDIIPVNCSEISMEGGLLNCIAWEHD